MKTFKMAGVRKFDGSQECDPGIWKHSMETLLGTCFICPQIYLRISFLWLYGAALSWLHSFYQLWRDLNLGSHSAMFSSLNFLGHLPWTQSTMSFKNSRKIQTNLF